MSYGIRCVARADGGPCDVIGEWLGAYDPEARRGLGHILWVDDAEDAMSFERTGDAFKVWRMVSRARPIRDDGQPNRPLTAYTVEIVELQ